MKFIVIHTNITVADLEKSIEFYDKALGMKVARRFDGADGGFRLAFLEAEPGGHRIELTWYRDRDPYKPGDNEVRGGFIPHVGFAPDDFDEALKRHREMGIVCFESEKRGVYFIEDPDGHWMEIVPLHRALGTPPPTGGKNDAKQ